MGFKTEFNWILKLKPEQCLDENNINVGEKYDFIKEDYRVYPIDMPIDLVNKDWEAIAKVIVTESKTCNQKIPLSYHTLKGVVCLGILGCVKIP